MVSWKSFTIEATVPQSLVPNVHSNIKRPRSLHEQEGRLTFALIRYQHVDVVQFNYSLRLWRPVGGHGCFLAKPEPGKFFLFARKIFLDTKQHKRIKDNKREHFEHF